MSRDFRLDFVQQDLDFIVEYVGRGYNKLAENPDFTYAEFQVMGGWSQMEIYKRLIITLKVTGSRLDLDAHLGYAVKIEKIYNTRWGIL